MKIRKYTVMLLLATVFGACQQDEIAPSTDPNVKVIEGEGGAYTLSGAVSYEKNYKVESGEDNGLRSVTYGMDTDTPNPLFEGQTTTLTCIIKSDDVSKPTTIVDVVWTNTGEKTVKLNNFPITLTNGTDLTQGNWYIMAFFTTNGGASGQTFTFDKSTGNINIAAPASNAGTGYTDKKTTYAYAGNNIYPVATNTGNTDALPSFFASPWQKLTVEVIDGTVAAKINTTLQLMPQGSLLGIYDEYYVPGMNGFTSMYGPLDAIIGAQYLNYHNETTVGNDYRGNPVKISPYTGISAKTLFRQSDMENYYFTDPAQIKIDLPGYTTMYGTYHLLPDGVVPVEGQYTMTFTTTNPSYAQAQADNDAINALVTEKYQYLYDRVNRYANQQDWWNYTLTDAERNELREYLKSIVSKTDYPWYSFVYTNPSPQQHKLYGSESGGTRQVRYLWANSALSSLRYFEGGPATTLVCTPSYNTAQPMYYVQPNKYRYRHMFYSRWRASDEVEGSYLEITPSPQSVITSQTSSISYNFLMLNGGCYIRGFTNRVHLSRYTVVHDTGVWGIG